MPHYITITGQKHYYSLLPFVLGAVFSLKREPENLHDPEAVSVISSVYGKVGMVANQSETIAQGTLSASGLTPFLSKNTFCVVRFIAGDYIIAEIYDKEEI